MEISATSLLLPNAPSLHNRASSLSSCNSIFFSQGRRDVFRKHNSSLVLDRSRAHKGLNCRCLFGLGVPELAVIAGVAVLVFGPKKLPEVGRSIGKTIKGFQQAAKEFETELKKEPEDSIGSTAEKSTAVSESEKQDLGVSGTKESL